MKKLEHVNCNLCGQDNIQSLYVSNQFSNSVIGKVDIQLVICKNCNFIYQNPQLTEEILEAHYSSNSSGDIFRLDHEESRAKILLKERQQFIYDSLNSIKIKSICDVGGGTGNLLSSLELSPKIKKYLVEPSDAIDKNNDSSVIKIKKRIESIADNEFKKFDYLMCISALEHFKNPSMIMNTFNNLISENGYIFIEVPNSLKPYNTFAEYYSHEHLNHFTYETLLSLLKKSGFYPVKIDESNSVQTIRVLARKNNKSQTQTALIQFFDTYQKEKDKFLHLITDKIERFVQEGEASSFSIYGAGDHTRFLLERFNCIDKIDYFIDSDPKKWGADFYGKKIISPSEMATLKIETILISSHDFEKEIHSTIKDCAPHINIISIYGDYE